MKKLILVRHAKSSWKENNISDLKRPLNKRGLRDAPFMGGILKNMGIKPDVILSSPALRASETAKYISAELGLGKSDIKYDEDIYEASEDELLDLINSVTDLNETILMVGHNPGLTDLANYIGDKSIDNIPTAGVAAYAYNGEWVNLNRNSCKMLFFEYPKKHMSAEENE